MIKAIRHTGIVVDDLSASLDFYTNKLGFSVVKEMNESGSFIDTILGMDGIKVLTVKMILNEGQMIELLDFQTCRREQRRHAINDIGPTHLAFTVNSVDEIYNEFIREGIEFISPPEISPDGYAKVAFCKAPEGTYVELVELLND